MLYMVALDLGAESGRAVLGCFDGEHLEVEEIHRFPNTPVRAHDTLYWDVLMLFREIKLSLQHAARRTNGSIASIGVDTWGVDFALLDRCGRLVGNPVHYRDRRTEGMMERVFQLVPAEEIYARTGIQFMPINTLYQLFAMVANNDPQLEIVDAFLMMPDLFHYWLTGEKVCEFTNATTTQCYNPLQGDWARDILERLGIPTHMFPQIIPPGTVLGSLRPEIAEETGAKAARVAVPATHDTGSAVAAVPFLDPNAAYISSGTWSLVGVEVKAPLLDERARNENFTNEGGVAGTFRLLKNVMGLWLLQESRRTWEAQGQRWDYEALVRLAGEAPPFKALIDPDDARFLPPGDIPARIREFCRETGQPEPETPGEVVRTILESLALKYRWVIERLEVLLGRPIPLIHVVGGGSRNHLLCQWTADAAHRPVFAGPVEATAIGNLMVQAMALGEVRDLTEVREVIRRSFRPVKYEPRDSARWDEPYQRFVEILSSRPS